MFNRNYTLKKKNKKSLNPMIKNDNSNDKLIHFSCLED